MTKHLWRVKRSFEKGFDSHRNRHMRSADFIIKSFLGSAEKQGRVLCLFAHFDEAGELKPYDRFHIQHLQRDLKCDVVFTSTNIDLDNEIIRQWLTQNTILTISRKNKGHDFGSWKCALDILGQRIADYDFILFVNNSVIGPLHPLDSILDKIDATENCVLGITESVEREYHLQSYFLLVTRKVFTGRAFAKFWQNFRFLDNKRNVVFGYEIGFSRSLSKSGVELRPLCPTAGRVPKNPTYDNWFDLIKDMGCPYVKRDLLRRLGLGSADIVKLQNWVRSSSGCDPQFIATVLSLPL